MKGACAALALALALFVRPGQVIIRLPTPALTLLTPSSGVIGASITITGTNFGGRGNGFVTVNGSPATIVSWAATSITITIPNTTTGPVIVTQNGLPSNSLTLTIGGSTGTTFYVAPTGLDSRTCTQAQTITTPKQTLNSAVACLSPGTTLLVRAGTYIEHLYNVVPSGTSWAATVRIAAYPGETVWLAPSSGDWGLYFGGDVGGPVYTTQYIEFDGINIDATALDGSALTNDDRNGSATNYIRFTNAEIMGRGGAGGSSSAVAAGGNNWELTHLVIHGDWFIYGIYAAGNNNLIDDCDISHVSTAGVHMFKNGGTPTGNIVRNSRIHDLTQSYFSGAPYPYMWGIIVYGNNNTIYNNLIYNLSLTYTGGSGGIVLADGTGHDTYNNTIANNTGTEGVLISSSVTDSWVVNTISYNNVVDPVSDGGTGNHLLTNLTTDPLFVNAGANNFHLQAGSAAIDTGTPSNATSDPDGVPRPTGAAFDIGAYERGAPVITLLTPNSGAVGASVVITGTGFGATKGSATVTFNSVTATTTAWATTSITATVPSTTTGPVVVTQNGLASAGVTFTVSGASSTVCSTGTVRFVKAAATGSGTGLDWTNAMGLPAAPARGTTYCLADGAYGSKTWNTANSGTTIITIRKATVADHGTSTGWSDTLGDGQATFGGWEVDTDYWVFSGAARNADWYLGTTSQYGIHVTDNGRTIRLDNGSGTGADNSTFEYLDIDGGGRDSCTGGDNIYGLTGNSNLTFQYNAIHDNDRTNFLMRGNWVNLLIQYSYIARNTSRPSSHGEMMSMTDATNLIIRWNVIEDTEGTAGMVAGLNGGTWAGGALYGNTYRITPNYNVGRTGCPDQHDSGTAGMIYVANDASNNNFGNNILFYNNTIYQATGSYSGVIIQSGSGNAVRNNLWYNSIRTNNSFSGTISHNWYFNTVQDGDTDPNKTVCASNCSVFVDPTNGNLHLAVALAAPGVTLAAPYNVDRDGVTRGADGVWDRGALEKP